MGVVLIVQVVDVVSNLDIEMYSTILFATLLGIVYSTLLSKQDTTNDHNIQRDLGLDNDNNNINQESLDIIEQNRERLRQQMHGPHHPPPNVNHHRHHSQNISSNRSHHHNNRTNNSDINYLVDNTALFTMRKELYSNLYKSIYNLYQNLAYTENQLDTCIYNRDRHSRSKECIPMYSIAEDIEKKKEKMYIDIIKTFKNERNEKRVISLGLYGDNPKYTIGAIRNAEMRDTSFPGWILRVYHSNVPNDILETLKSLSVELVHVENANTLSRFEVISDNTVDRFIVSDSDSRINASERLAVEEWIQSNRSIHIMRDHKSHCYPINAGMWGGVKNIQPELNQKLLEYSRTNSPNILDMAWLADHLLQKYPRSDIIIYHTIVIAAKDLKIRCHFLRNDH